MKRNLFVLLCILLLAHLTAAQEDATPEAVATEETAAAEEPAAEAETYGAQYEGIPFSRTEDGAFVLGDPEAPVTLVEFADFMCPACQVFEPEMQQFIEEFVASGQVKLEYRLFPVVDPNYSEYTAQIAECVDEQREGGFWAAHDLLYALATAGSIGPNTDDEVATTLDLDAEALTACLETADQYLIDYAYGEQNNITATPSLRVRLGDEESLRLLVREDGAPLASGGLQFEGLQALFSTEDLESVTVLPLNLAAGLLTGEPCEAPCWNGITPGETTFEEAQALLEEIPDFSNFQLQEAETGEAKLLRWAQNNSACCDMLTLDGESVTSLTLTTAMSPTFAEVNEVYGEPQYATAISDPQAGYTQVSLFYNDASLVLTTLLQDETFTEENPVQIIQYFAPDAYQTIIESEPLVEWQGFEDYTVYAPSGAAEATPETTPEAEPTTAN